MTAVTPTSRIHSLTLPLAALAAALFALLLAAPLAAQETPDAAPTPPRNEAPNIFPGLAARLVELGAPVLDVRSEEEVAETGLVANATRISHDQLDEIETFLGDDSNRAVVIYCGSGRRASRVIEAMRERGYGGLVNAGGYEDLTAAIDGAGEG